MRRLLPLAAIITALLALPALLVPASADQLGAVLGLGETVAGAPTAVRPFPVLGGMGVTWAAPDGDPPTGYQVERKRLSGNWAGESGSLDATTTRWVDRNLQPDATAEYRVVALYPDQQIASDPITAHRVAEDPAIGDTDILMIDANRGEGATWLQDEIAGPVSVTAPTDGATTLSAGTIRVKLPALLPGPGTYDLPSTQVTVAQGDRSCAPAGRLIVTELAYTPDLEVATMAASLRGWTCTSTYNGLGAEIRVKSTKPYSAIRVDPDEIAFGQVRVGSTPTPHPITIKSVGTEPLQLDRFNLSASAAWGPISHDCPDVLPAGQTCTVTVPFAPQHTGDDVARLVISDSTAWGWHTVSMSGTGTALPNALDVGVAATFTGHVIRWSSLQRAGGTKVRGYFLHKYVDGTESTTWVEASPVDRITVTNPNPQPGVTYAVSVVNEVGEGPTGTPRAPRSATDQIVVVTGRAGYDHDLMAADLYGGLVSLPADANDSATAKEAVATSPDGRSIAYVSSGYVTGGTVHGLRVRRIDPTTVQPSTELWTSQAPIRHPAWSTDGTRIAFVVREGYGQTLTPCVYVISSTGGTPEKVDCNMTSPSWMPDGRSLAVIDHRTGSRFGFVAQVEGRSGGTRLKAFKLNAADDTPLRVSPNGDLIAVGTAGRVKTIRIGDDVTNESPYLGDQILSISWGPDGKELLALTDKGRLTRLAVDSAGAMTDRPPIDIWTSSTMADVVDDIAWQALNVTIGATPAVSGPQVSIPFDSSALPADASVTCELYGSISPCASPARATIASSGPTSLRVWSTDSTGRTAVAVRTFVVDATGPVARVTAPAYEASTAATATVRYAATDSGGVKSYDVRYRKATYNGAFGAYSQPWTGTTATSVSLGLAAGYEYCVSVRARDTFGNLGAWSAERCFARPMDDRALTMASAGWTRGSWSAFYLNTATYTGKYGISLTRTVQGKRFYLVATRCNTCGLVSVYLGGKYIGAVNLWASTTQRQVVIGLPAQSSLFTGTLKITTRSTGKLVQIDGLGVRRT